MKLLIDTNIFIPLEPLSARAVEPTTPLAARLAEQAGKGGVSLYVHPASLRDLKRDSNLERRKLRELQYRKYPALPRPPRLSARARGIIGDASAGSNDWVDNQLLAALDANAIDYLVSEDVGVLRKAQRLGLDGRVLALADAIVLVEDLFDEISSPPPAVEAVKAHELEVADPIFDSFRAEYPGFDQWLEACQRRHRDAWVIRNRGGALAGVAIVKREEELEYGLSGKVLKLCSFKVAAESGGFRFGELLLKSVFDHAVVNCYDRVFVTVFERHVPLIHLFETFGFRALNGRSKRNELVFEKPTRPPTGVPFPGNAWEFDVRYGPYHVMTEGVPIFAVPILPAWHRMLLPEAEEQLELQPGLHPCGNAIRKAYLSRARISVLAPGALLFFYRSQQNRGLTAVGVVEETLRSCDPDEIARFVGTRTVYRYREIQKMCEVEVLAVLFRLSRTIRPPVELTELKQAGVLSGPPQSITELRGEAAKQWMTALLSA